jgi:hypothetical protein
MLELILISPDSDHQHVLEQHSHQHLSNMVPNEVPMLVVLLLTCSEKNGNTTCKQ